MRSRRPIVWLRLAVAAFGVLLMASPFAAAQTIRTEQLRFGPGETVATASGNLRGYGAIDYGVTLQAGQKVVFEFQPGNPSAYFNVTAPGAQAALFVGSQSGNRFETEVLASGAYVVRTYLMRNAARRNETSNFVLTVRLLGGAPDYADGLAGGPDYWQVTRAPNGRLGLLAQPSNSARMVTNLAEGGVARSLGCRLSGGQKWCQLETLDGRYRGWSEGRHLREGAPPSPPSVPIPRPPAPAPQVIVGGNGEGEVVFEGNNCVAYYDVQGVRRRNNVNCFSEQLQLADETMARHRREEGRR